MNETTIERDPMSSRQKDVFEWVVEKNLDGQTVGLRDVARHFGYGTNAAANHIKALVKKGYLKPTEAGRSNSLKPVDHVLQVLPTAHANGLRIQTTGPVEITRNELAELAGLLVA